MAATKDNPPAILISSTDTGLPEQLPVGLAKYTGFREMARGGNALLRSCFDTVANRTVAVKTLLPEFRGRDRDRRRFLREARVTAQLQHPNTVPVYEIGHDPAEGLYFTMKRISGENFFEVLKRIARGDQRTVAEYPVSRRVDIVADACQALAYAHARGVIHRDVKPENIWVGNFGEVVLLDWGAAKVWGQPDDYADAPAQGGRQGHGGEELDRTNEADGPGEPEQSLTLADQRPGTPLYMSPEQVSRSTPVDERTDVFSTGVVLYEMLTLSEPFRGRAISATFDNILNRTPPAPSLRAAGRAGAASEAIPAALDAVVMRALAKDPAERHQGMPALIAELRAAID
ncbi:MAG: serine/threonine-protein kinase [Planctomycetota bacterium]